MNKHNALGRKVAIRRPATVQLKRAVEAKARRMEASFQARASLLPTATQQMHAAADATTSHSGGKHAL